MKKRLIQITLAASFLMLTGLLTANAIVIINNFTTTSSNGNVVITWQTSEETDVKSFIVVRKPVNGTSFSNIATVKAKGNNSYYEYVDEGAYKTTDAVFVYNLKVVDNAGVVSDLGLASHVSNNVSGVKQTWGSIKALFR